MQSKSSLLRLPTPNCKPQRRPSLQQRKQKQQSKRYYGNKVRSRYNAKTNEEESTKVEVELLEATAHGPAAGALRDSTAVLFCDECVDAAGAETAYTFRTSIALFQYAESSTAGAVYLNRVREHGGRIRRVGWHDLHVCTRLGGFDRGCCLIFDRRKGVHV